MFYLQKTSVNLILNIPSANFYFISHAYSSFSIMNPHFYCYNSHSFIEFRLRKPRPPIAVTIAPSLNSGLELYVQAKSANTCCLVNPLILLSFAQIFSITILHIFNLIVLQKYLSLFRERINTQKC